MWKTREINVNEDRIVEEVASSEVKGTLDKMKTGKAVGPDNIPVEVWKFLGDEGIVWLTMYGEMPEEWRTRPVLPIFKNKGGIQECKNCRSIKLVSHIMKMWERVIEKRLREVVTISDEKFGFMAGKSTTVAKFAFTQLIEKYREDRKKINCIFKDLEKKSIRKSRICTKPIKPM